MMAQVNTATKLDAYIKQHFDQKPLAYLSEPARQRFVAGLTFNDNGLTGFRYDDLEAELTYSQAYEILRLFGAQGKVSAMDLAVVTEEDAKLFGVISKSPVQLREDHRGYKCIGRYNCREQRNYICLSACAFLP